MASREYAASIGRSLEAIEQRLKGPLSLKEVAAEASLSYFHFHRVFQLVTGDTPKLYIRNRRLTEAAKELLQGRRLIDIALDYQFESQETFSRAFKRRFFLPPGEWRDRGGSPVGLYEPICLASCDGDPLNRLLNLEPEIVELPARRFAGCSRTGRNIHEENMRLAIAFRERAAELPGDTGLYGIERNYACGQGCDSYYYAVCRELPIGAAVPAGMEEIDLAAGQWAHFVYQGRSQILHTAIYGYIFNLWQFLSPYEILHELPKYEYFSPDYTSIERTPIELYLPVRGK